MSKLNINEFNSLSDFRNSDWLLNEFSTYLNITKNTIRYSLSGIYGNYAADTFDNIIEAFEKIPDNFKRDLVIKLKVVEELLDSKTYFNSVATTLKELAVKNSLDNNTRYYFYTDDDQVKQNGTKHLTLITSEVVEETIGKVKEARKITEFRKKILAGKNVRPLKLKYLEIPKFDFKGMTLADFLMPEKINYEAIEKYFVVDKNLTKANAVKCKNCFEKYGRHLLVGNDLLINRSTNYERISFLEKIGFEFDENDIYYKKIMTFKVFEQLGA